MNKREAAQILAILKAAYPNNYKNLSQTDAQGIVSLWSMHFADISGDVVFMALNKAISVCKDFPPTIGKVKEKLEAVHWEAYELLEQNRRLKSLTDNELNTYKRIYSETARCKHGKNVEPPISHMLPRKAEVRRIE